MAKYKTTRVFPIVLLLIVVAVVIAALFSLARLVFFPDTTKQTNTVESRLDITKESLLKTDVSRSVRMTVRGPIVADENFRTSQITVSPTIRNISVYSGYLEDKIDAKDYSNNVPGYTEFVYALNKAEFISGEPDSNDIRGICAPGYVYSFDVMKDNDVVGSRWTSSCGGSKGTLTAYLPQIKALFDGQIPDLKTIIKKNSL